MKSFNKLPLWTIVVLALFGVESCKRFVDNAVANAKHHKVVKVDQRSVDTTKNVLNGVSLLAIYIYCRKMFLKK